MFKTRFFACCAGLCLLAAQSVYATALAEYNIAKGLPPALPSQSIASLTAFAGEFRILGTKYYQHDPQAKFSPVDFAVSWGVMAEPDIAKRIQISQYDRFLNWRLQSLPIPPQQAIQMVSNIHIIPANPEIAAQIQQVKSGDYVRLSGDLVEVKDGNLVWRSSLSTQDTGEGACEVFRVKQIAWLKADQASTPHTFS